MLDNPGKTAQRYNYVQKKTTSPTDVSHGYYFSSMFITLLVFVYQVFYQVASFVYHAYHAASLAASHTSPGIPYQIFPKFPQ